jgi:hypothetical protein
MRFTLVLVFLASVSIFGCSDADTEKPVLTDLSITPSPTIGLVCDLPDSSVIEVLSGDSIAIFMNVSDNELLRQYKIDVHSNFDCHAHAKLETADWAVSEVVELSGTSAQISRSILIPDSATAGTYHLSIQVADHFGNSVKTEIYSLLVSNRSDTIAPVLMVIQPNTLDLVVSLSDTIPNDSIIFIGTVSDNMNLGLEGNGRLEMRYWSDSAASIFTLFNQPFLETDGAEFNFGLSARVPPTLTAGGYKFELRAFDGVNNPAPPIRFSVLIE